MKREAQNLVLLLIGGAVLWITLDGSYARYVKPSLHPYLLVSAAGFIVLALVAIVRDIRRGAAPDEHDEHEHGTGRAQWLLLLPIAALLFIAPPALGANGVQSSSPVQAITGDAASALPGQRAFPPLPAGDAPAVPVVELVQRALQDSTHSLDGREVTISGFIVRPKDLERDHPGAADADLAKVVITCCVADAQYALVHLAGLPEVIPDDQWLQLRGIVRTDSARHDPELTPTFDVTDYQLIPTPKSTYEAAR
ncbi:TIGR03943 family putative permease subunit [Nocardia sp. NBC_01327]|uniref:TIGR03943 family putative permease subunit n=1 Tax=Nocardia sp. NBC_01327 TaxID=2903593 RepID=UPI002E0F5DBD|nr:TIGR03943 family protein [Nocardia sp. NBC_01327]